MKILFVGDIVGRGGRRVLKEHLHSIQREHDVDFTIVNVENAAGGFGVTPAIAEEVLGLGADAMTSGNHIWDRRETLDYLDREPRLLRPANYPPGLPGKPYFIGESPQGIPVAVINLQGRVFMANIDCPFRAADQILREVRNRARVIIVDFHAEATSEKMAFGWHVDGRASAVLGTHTHVPTADARILNEGTAYISDVGMTGSYQSVIGMQVQASLARFLTGIGSRFEPASESPRLCAVLLDVDEQTGRASSIRRCDRP
jgi:2',3'-cyclic-nucleotide 2'-phosphodiesterase